MYFVVETEIEVTGIVPAFTAGTCVPFVGEGSLPFNV